MILSINEKLGGVISNAGQEFGGVSQEVFWSGGVVVEKALEGWLYSPSSEVLPLLI